MTPNTQPRVRLERLTRVANEVIVRNKMPDAQTFGEMIRDITTCLKLLLDLWPVLNDEETPMEQPAPQPTDIEQPTAGHLHSQLVSYKRQLHSTHMPDDPIRAHDLDQILQIISDLFYSILARNEAIPPPTLPDTERHLEAVASNVLHTRVAARNAVIPPVVFAQALHYIEMALNGEELPDATYRGLVDLWDKARSND